MGTISERKSANRKPRLTAQIRIKKGGKIVHSEAETWETRAKAETWLKKREKELAHPGAIERAKVPSVTLAHVIDTYLAETIKAIGKTKAQVLRSIKSYDIAEMKCEEITSQHLVAFGKELAVGRDPSTVGNYFSHLAKPFALARPAWNYPLNEQALRDAVVVLKELGLISKSNKRDRRPTLGELDLLMQFFLDRQARAPQSNPMHRIIAFALFSTRRQEEIVRIMWGDFDEEGKRILVRDMKHPGQQRGNDNWCELPDEAIAIIKAMPRASAFIFPYSTDAISAAFTRACQVLGIEDLHFHDLRHEGVSRLFEMGRGIPQAAAVSGHKSWSSLKVYANHLRQTGDKYAGWKWLPIVTAPMVKIMDEAA